VLVETNGITLPLFNALLKTNGFADMEALAAEIAVLQACLDAGNENGACADAEENHEFLTALYNLGLLSMNSGPPGQGKNGGPLTGLEIIDGSPVTIEGGISEGGVTSGPNFETGRRTWTDILPQ